MGIRRIIATATAFVISCSAIPVVSCFSLDSSAAKSRTSSGSVPFSKENKASDEEDIIESTRTPVIDQTTPSADEIDEKFIVTPEDVEIAPGERKTINIYAENGSDRKAAQFIAQVIDENLPIKCATATMSKVKCSAVPVASEYKEINGTWYCDTLDSGEPQEIDTSKPVARFDITIPANTKAGTYEWKLDRFHVVESGYDAIEFDAVLKTGKIIVTDIVTDIVTEIYTHPIYTYGKVNSYPTKTIYECGEELDFSGIEFESEGGGQTYDAQDLAFDSEGAKMHKSVIGEDGASHEFSEFSTLPAGEYTVVLEGSTGGYYNYDLCQNVYITYNVTIRPESATEATTSEKKLIGTWSEKTPHNSGDLPIVFKFNEDGTARISWKNDSSGYYVPITWSTEDDVLQYHEEVEDGSDASYFISFSDDALVLQKTKNGDASYVLYKDALSLGDVNNDSKVDAKDASLILVEYASLSTDGKSVLSDEVKNAADVNKDGKVDSKDASSVLQYYAYTSTGGTGSIEEFLE